MTADFFMIYEVMQFSESGSLSELNNNTKILMVTER